MRRPVEPKRSGGEHQAETDVGEGELHGTAEAASMSKDTTPPDARLVQLTHLLARQAAREWYLRHKQRK